MFQLHLALGKTRKDRNMHNCNFFILYLFSLLAAPSVSALYLRCNFGRSTHLDK